MSSTLTENVVLVRTRSHDLNSVKKLNCWGCTLKDVSIVNRMPNVEVISLSINSIDTLQYFSSCTMLQELYLRKNEIKDINEILYLSQLQFLKKLSLEDNPCANIEQYRLTVLKALPNLEYLDNVKVTAEELYQAEKLGKELVWPGTECDDEIEDEIPEPITVAEYNTPVNCYETATSATPIQDLTTSSSSSSNQVSPHQTITTANNSNNGLSSLGHDYQTSPMNYNNNHMNSNGMSSTESVGNSSNISYSNNRNSNHHHNHHHHGGGSGNHSASSIKDNSKQRTNMAKANSLSDYNIYSNNGNFRCSSPALSGATAYEPIMNEYYENGQTNNVGAGNGMNGPMMGGGGNGHNNNPQQYYLPNNNYHHRSGSSSRATNIQSANSSSSSQQLQQQQQQQRLPKGGKNRNANILSAVLCLIKELDYGSLEVVDTTIHCRMEEMED